MLRGRIFEINEEIIMGGQICVFLHFSQKNSSVTYMMKLYVNSYFILMKTLTTWFGQKMSRGHVVDIYIAWVENDNFKIVILGYLEAF